MFRKLNYDDQSGFLAHSIELCPPTERKVLAAISQRKYTVKYILNINGSRQEVCRTTMTSVFAITPDRIHTIKMKLEAGHIFPKDGRGKHGNHKVIPESVRDHIRNHIRRFPVYESHYCRGDANTERRYLEPGLTITKLYAMFIEYQRENDLPEAEKWA